jgi:hypothetical protein
MTLEFIKRLFPYGRRLNPYRTDSIDEFVNKVKEYQGTTVRARIGHISKIRSRENPKSNRPDTYSAKIVANTLYGRPVIFKKKYGTYGNKAMGDISYAINQTSKIPNLISIIRNPEGKELRPSQYALVRTFPEGKETKPEVKLEELAIVKAYIEDDI